MKANNNKPAFWVTNVSNRNVTLADLALNIKAYSTVNLLDAKHYSLNLDQLNNSKISGSIFKKRHMIKVRNVAPPPAVKEAMPFLRDNAIPSRERSVLDIKMPDYPELKIEDKLTERELEEKLASENADLELTDKEIQDQVVANKKVK